MRAIVLVLACLACTDLGRRVQPANEKVEDSFDAEHQSSHRESEAQADSLAAPKKKKRALLAMLLLALKPGADALSNTPAVAGRGAYAGHPAVTQHGPLALRDLVGLRQNRADVQMQLPREDWPNGNKWYRFFQEEGGDDARGYIYKTPKRYVGTRALGTYEDSNRVTFTLPVNKEDAPQVKIIELLVSKEKDRPSFGAVEATLPLNMNIRSFGVGNLFSGQDRVVVVDVLGGKAKSAGIEPRDLIRAVSMPKEQSSSNPWWDLMGMTIPEVEEGMAMLDNTGVAAYQGAILANVRANGPNAKVVLLVERPASEPGGGLSEVERKSVFRGDSLLGGQPAGAGAPGSPG